MLTEPPSQVLSPGDSEVVSAPRALCSTKVCAGSQVSKPQLLPKYGIRAEWNADGQREALGAEGGGAWGSHFCHRDWP